MPLNKWPKIFIPITLSKINKKINTNGPRVSKKYFSLLYFGEYKIAYKILEPSSGGIGTKLKTINITFNITKSFHN